MPWVTVIVTTFALFALAKAYIILDLNWCVCSRFHPLTRPQFSRLHAQIAPAGS